MPLCYLRRPLFLGLILYILALSWLHSRGYFIPKQPPPVFQAHAELEGRVVSPRREDFRGLKVVVDLGDRHLLVYLPRESPINDALRPGQRIALKGRLRAPRPAGDSGGFDERAFLHDRGIWAVMKASKVEILADAIPWRWRAQAWAEGVRHSIEESFERGVGGVEARLLTGLTLGYKGPLPKTLNRAIQDAGVMHLLVPSGAKVAFVMLAAAWFSSFACFSAMAAWIFGAAVGGFYVLMVGADAPYLRAYIAALCLQAGLRLGRESGAFQATVISAGLILIFDPRALFSAGFQMTYAAMAGLLAGLPTVRAILPKRWPRLARARIQTLAVTVIVQIMLWPISADMFGRGSVIGALSNIVFVPLSGVLMAAAFLFWALFLATNGWPPLWAEQGLRGAAMLFAQACRAVASWPCAAVDLWPWEPWEVVAYYSAVAVVLLWPRLRRGPEQFSIISPPGVKTGASKVEIKDAVQAGHRLGGSLP